MSHRIYKSGNALPPGFTENDDIGWYREVSDEEFDKLKEDGAVFDKDGVFYYKSSASDDSSSGGSSIKSFFSNMFENPGATIKKIAKVLFYIGLAVTFIYGISAGYAAGEVSYDYWTGDASHSFSFGTTLVAWISGAVGTYLSCLVLATLGDIAANLAEINKKIK